MQALALNPAGLLAFFRAQLVERQPRFRSTAGELALLAPHPACQASQQCQALETLQAEGSIAGFHLVRTPRADAFLVELTPAG